MIRVFVIAPSAARAQHIRKVLAADDTLQIARLSFEDTQPVHLLQVSQAQIVAIDAACGAAEMQRMTQDIMHQHPIPIVILAESGRDAESGSPMEALEAGALTVLPLPDPIRTLEGNGNACDLCRSLRLMAEVKVVRRWDHNRFEALQRITHPSQEPADRRAPVSIIAIGASAGGTKALQNVFSTMHAGISVPILVVQHIAKGYIAGLANWLDEQTPLHVRIAEHGIEPEAGTIYLAPDDHHLTVGSDHRIVLSDEESVNGFRPSIARLFASIAETYKSRAAAVLLSGMGNDGAAEMRRLFDLGACTIAQDKETALIHGIPGEAIKLQAARFVLPVQEIGSALESVAGSVATPRYSGTETQD